MYDLSDIDENDFGVVVGFYPLQGRKLVCISSSFSVWSFSPFKMHQIPIPISFIHQINLNCLNEEFGKKILSENNRQERHFLLSQKKQKQNKKKERNESAALLN